MVGRRRLVLVAAIAAVALFAGACSSDDSGDGGGDDAKTRVTSVEDGLEAIRVPGDQKTIQAAVDSAEAGDLILVSEGVYKEAVDVTTADITIRGVDRNKVILDGEFTADNGIRVLDTDGVVVENMTARNYISNGFYWTGSDRYRGSYLTAYRNGDYGIYAFDSYHGQFDHSYGSGSPDAGFYIGECYKCDAVLSEVVSEYNGLGYSGTNSGGDLYIVNSEFRNNRAGIVPNSGSYELCYPSRGTTIAGNLVHDNNMTDGPGIDVSLLAQGNGILPAGAVRVEITRNRVWNHDRTG
ncbi:MAG TPA: right-handed parallel beta-helix repeat-containing protein, partial [Microthrixaceae bacterium]|nr:right-handed parallel beta-helix repeat-containing protein [Microthrixaceae bacterium]